MAETDAPGTLIKKTSKDRYIKYSSIYLIIVSALVILSTLVGWIYDRLNIDKRNSEDSFGWILVGMTIVSILVLPGLVAGICGAGYYKKRNKNWRIASLVCGWIAAIIYGLLILGCLWTLLGESEINLLVFGFFASLIIFTVVLPIVLFLTGIYRE